jgi:hypothetical protein
MLQHIRVKNNEKYSVICVFANNTQWTVRCIWVVLKLSLHRDTRITALPTADPFNAQLADMLLTTNCYVASGDIGKRGENV